MSAFRALSYRGFELETSFDPPVLPRGEDAHILVNGRGRPLPRGAIIVLALRSGSRREEVSLRFDRYPSRASSGSVPFFLPPLPRGVFRPELLRLLIPDPLGLSYVVPRCTLRTDTLRVTPRARDLDFSDLLRGEGSGSPSQSLRWRRTGERVDVRPYVPGDDIGRIHWKVYAHTGELFFRIPEEQPPPAQAVHLLIDADQREESLLDQVIECTLGLARALEAREYPVLLFVRRRVGDAPVTIPVGPPDRAPFLLAALDHTLGVIDGSGWPVEEKMQRLREGILVTVDSEEERIILVREGGWAIAAHRLASPDRER